MPSPFDKTLSLIETRPGIKRDGTRLDGNFFSDGEWCRFRLGRPKKMGGYREIANGLNGPIRGVHVHPKSPQHIASLFSDSGVQCQLLDSDGRPGGTFDRTPTDLSVGSNNHYTWTYDTLYDATGTPATKIIAHACSTDFVNPDSNSDNPVFIGDVDSPNALTSISGVIVSGGIVVLQPFLFAYGSNGLIMNSKANGPTDFLNGDANAANVAGTKIIKGLPLRGGASAPAGLFWALDSLIRVSYVGGTGKWRYDQVAGDSSILCANGVIEYDGVYFWPGIDRFLMYNGVISELPNPMNQDFFFDNLNWDVAQKVWATTVKRWGEIWWFFPKGDSTECNHAIIYNVREKSWYDTPISRSAGAAAKVLHFPVWAEAISNSDTGSDGFRLYRHETGLDAVSAQSQSAIRSYFETGSISLATKDGLPETPNVQTRLTKIEPDFNMTGKMLVSVLGSSNAQADEAEPKTASFNPSTSVVDLVTQRRVMRLRFESNLSGGDYHMGKTLLHIEPGDPHQ